ncbi:hypothetical protein B0H11DRAFT_524516 [Mycena galericulata]|nr:hypothetical protein B0H11DRAFT_524516 [Mycena galericulata]
MLSGREFISIEYFTVLIVLTVIRSAQTEKAPCCKFLARNRRLEGRRVHETTVFPARILLCTTASPPSPVLKHAFLSIINLAPMRS